MYMKIWSMRWRKFEDPRQESIGQTIYVYAQENKTFGIKIFESNQICMQPFNVKESSTFQIDIYVYFI